MASAHLPLRDFDATFGFHEKAADDVHPINNGCTIVKPQTGCRHALRSSTRSAARGFRHANAGNPRCRTDDRLFPPPINGHLAMQGTRRSRHRQCRCR
ncbi:conserved hypothetical protein [Burkholderia cenocepacia HI2424]|uniref:Uncharacterized protein n=2 Tax=Burkholderia cepacia complex TaxID=87882 RepID=A0A427NUG2_9BURK|nr:conserved hypothetical protein [Burkholderia cenocepacia HI2424]PNO65929.1 hypothetical protein DK10_032445 [Burkholderia cenocepacia]RSC11119.1 hypothetical protein EGT41_22310 [Burkholderia cenocepacia]